MDSREQTIAKIERLVAEGIEKQDINYFQQAFNVCHDWNDNRVDDEYENREIFMAEDDDYIMVNDEMFYFNGAFGSAVQPQY